MHGARQGVQQRAAAAAASCARLRRAVRAQRSIGKLRHAAVLPVGAFLLGAAVGGCSGASSAAPQHRYAVDVVVRVNLVRYADTLTGSAAIVQDCRFVVAHVGR